MSDDWNNRLVNDTIGTLWIFEADRDRERKLDAAVAALIGIGPKCELEGMMAAQLLASHYAAMECYRRAMLPNQTFEGRNEALSQANKLSRTHAALLDALNRHRGKGQQKVTVEHVHVHSGGQAIVGNVNGPGGGDAGKSEGQSRAQQIGHAPEQPMRSPDPAMPNGRCRMHGGASPGAPKGNRNAYKHGRYTAEAIKRRRELAALLRAMRALSAEA